MTDALARMLARLAVQEVPGGPGGATVRPLAALTTRDRDDPAIAVLDAWAGVLRVASFYHDRILEEGYLSSAREDYSILQLARTVGYEPRPGLAASASLAFTVITQPGLPDTVTVPADTAVRSIPSENQQPQVFETVESLVARPEWNILRAASQEALPVRADADQIALSGPAGIRVGEPVLVVGAEPAQRYVAVVARAETGPDGRPLISFQSRLAGAAATAEPVAVPQAFTLPTRLRLFGHDAPDVPDDQVRRAGGLHRFDPQTGSWRRLDDGLPAVAITGLVSVQRSAGPALLLAATDGRGVYRSADQGASWTPAGAALATRSVPALCADPDGTLYAAVGDDGAIVRSRDDGATWQRLSTGGPAVTADPGAPPAQVYALAARAGMVFAATDDGVFRSTDHGTTWLLCMALLGVRAMAVTETDLVCATTTPGLLITAPLTITADTGYGSIEVDRLRGRVPRALCPLPGPAHDVAVGTDDALLPAGLLASAVELPTPGVRALTIDAAGGVVVALEPGAALDEDWPTLAVAPGQDWVDLDRVAGEAGTGRWLVLTGRAGASAWPIVAADTVNRSDFGRSARVTRVRLGTGAPLEGFLGRGVRTTEVLVSGEPLPLPTTPITGTRITLDRPVPPLPAGRPLVVTGTTVDQGPGPGRRDGGETVVVAGMPDERTIVLETALAHDYEPTSFAGYANVALATHGETVESEVLGSGDSTAPDQRFTLSRAPLTHVPASTDAGARAVLVVSVDGVPWTQVDTLRDAGPADEVYLARRDGEGRTEVVFGDGEHGARPRTGVDNVTVRYRYGLGQDGNVVAHGLTLLQTRPLGVQEVTNPLPATGGADPEPGRAARSGLAGQVLAVNRLVAPADFEHFARAFTGIAAAQAVVLSADGFRLLHLTVAGLDGQPVPRGSALHDSLVKAMDQRRPSGPSMTVDSYHPLLFAVAARLLVDRRHDARAVRAAAEQAIRDAFAVGRRDFGQPVHRGELVALLHGVSGVLAVDLDGLAPDGAAMASHRVLPCQRARWLGGAALPAELLVPGPISLSTFGG